MCLDLETEKTQSLKPNNIKSVTIIKTFINNFESVVYIVINGKRT